MCCFGVFVVIVLDLICVVDYEMVELIMIEGLWYG